MRRRFAFAYPLQQWQHESNSFSGAGLSNAHHVAALRHGWDDPLLNWGRIGISLGIDSPKDWLGKAEVVELCQ